MKKPQKNNPSSPSSKPSGEAKSTGSKTEFASRSGSAPSAVVVRETSGEPTSARLSTPALLVALLAALLFWGDLYIVDHGGELDARVYTPYRSAEQLAAFRPLSEDDKIIARGRIVYKNCAGCHQDTGLGNPGSGWPPLAGSEWVTAEGPNRLIRIVLEGLQGPITVGGREFNTAVMLPWRSAFTDDQIADVLSYIRNDWGNKAGLVKPEQVKAIRQATEDRNGIAWTADELLRVPVK